MIPRTLSILTTFVNGCVVSWGQHVYDRIGNTAYTGVDDTKLFVWPGKGLFSITGRHQELVNSSEPICRDFNWMQYITQVCFLARSH